MRSSRPWIVLVASIVVASCGGGDDSGIDTTPPDSETAAATDRLPQELDHFGELARLVATPEPTTFSADATTLALPEGAVLDVPAGAFPGPTDVTIAVARLEFEQYVTDAPGGSVYLLSTDDDVALAQPLTLEFAAPSGELGVSRLVDGEWSPYEVPAGDSTRVAIEHFSSVAVAVVEPGAGDPEPIGPAPDGEAPAFFLELCIGTLGSTLEGTPPEYVRLAGDIIFSVCVNALIDRLSPADVYVSTACVGDEIGGDVDIRTAIARCQDPDGQVDADGQIDDLPDSDDPPDDVVADAATTTAVPTPSDDDPSAPADIGPLAWDGAMTLHEGSSLVPSGEPWVSVTRTAGTNLFEAAMEVATAGDHRFAVEGQIDPVECTSVLTKRFVGSGGFDADFPDRIVLVGEQEVDVEYDCAVEVAETLDGTKPFEVFVAVTDTGLEGAFEGFEFVLPGVPVAIAG